MKQKETKMPKNKNTLKADWVYFVWFMRVLKSLRKKDEVEPNKREKTFKYWNFVWDYLGRDLLILSRSMIQWSIKSTINNQIDQTLQLGLFPTTLI